MKFVEKHSRSGIFREFSRNFLVFTKKNYKKKFLFVVFSVFFKILTSSHPEHGLVTAHPVSAAEHAV